MNHQHPIFTVETECQDCYKCLRRCPVKAIRVENGHAKVIPEMCVSCGACVEACPVHAKRIRDDLGRARHLLRSGRAVFVSLAPSWVGEFPGVTEAAMAASLRQLGFTAVSETALGAQEVSAAVAADLARPGRGMVVSSACPSAVEYLYKYLPGQAMAVTQVHSPVLAHCRLLRRAFGDEIAVVFFGPCIAKKNESDRHPGLLDLALTFSDLRAWLEEAGIRPAETASGPEDRFVPERSQEGALYPVEGGMIETIKSRGGAPNARYVTLAGLDNIRRGLEGLDLAGLQTPLFVECLACEGGCIAGPCAREGEATLARRLRVEEYIRWPERAPAAAPTVALDETFLFAPAILPHPGAARIAEALKRVGKTSAADELNCGGCGYNTCRDFAAGLIEGRAEPTMCVSYMRKLAQKKANALLRCMPSAVVIADRDLRIIECNEVFGRMFGDDLSEVYDARPGLNGCLLAKVIPFADMFQTVLNTGREIRHDHHRCGARLFRITVFTLEAHEAVGAVILDVTRQEFHREQIARQANEVIQRNLSTVQDIACRLGEHMADTEILLRSIAEGFAAGDGRREG